MDEKYTGMLPAHRKMSEHDKCQMKSMRDAGIKTTHIYGFLAKQAGGYQNLRFMKKDMYKEQIRDCRFQFSDAKVALNYLETLRLKDEKMF